jgi:hypothetical protein
VTAPTIHTSIAFGSFALLRAVGVGRELLRCSFDPASGKVQVDRVNRLVTPGEEWDKVVEELELFCQEVGRRFTPPPGEGQDVRFRLRAGRGHLEADFELPEGARLVRAGGRVAYGPQAPLKLCWNDFEGWVRLLCEIGRRAASSARLTLV